MYTCPECGSHEITVRRYAVIIERWNGDDVEYEDGADERAPEDATAECDVCGEDTVDASEWYEY